MIYFIYWPFFNSGVISQLNFFYWVILQQPRMNIHILSKIVLTCLDMFHLLYCYRIDNTTNFKAAFFKLHYGSIIDTCSLRENKNGRVVWIRDVLFQSFCYCMSVFGFASFKPYMRGSSC